MNAVEVKKGIYWVGAIDWSLRNFHGYTTNRGVTYNAYLIIDEKIALIDTVKAQFAGELLERISKVIDPEKIDYIISNHVEMDHSGSIPKVMEVCKNAAIITSSPSGLKGLTAHYGQYNYKSVKANETLSLGKRTLKFVPTPMLHWPDNMVTYCPEEKILFSNDAFGQHYASSRRFDDEEQLEIILEEAKNYYGNIIMPYGKQVQGACEIICSLDIEMIAPSHGVIWRKNIQTIFDAYKLWSENNPQTGAIVVFDSMWHSTEVMAKTIVEAFADKSIPVKLYDLKVNHISEIIPEVLTSKYIAVGSPTLNNTMMPTVAAFLSYLKGLSPKNRKAFAFGSYGWGGQSIAQVEEELEKCGFDICLDKIRVQYIPSKQQLDEIRELVRNIE
ncbi:FprA family A-type flavoprotein [Clostridium saccharobutylicum]|uniref:Nitric oxide reductase FprA n=1 Tax=Clostridium saccharobutylicum DSM 13864 TaxID=1345695 RepID=U5MM52_CLOSA|nr:FprA family A-type flavoprotein [Clostridium saccharobutylicum]AGX41603.1 nitric oxide reductase FprA [Clostridium saccharobutylicum DSM 13864]AQR88884.1 nitric oxide reductase [Clostridium saccharobutylicum]AQR98783.1 nitric oxide reductase [Clostridium saccharobutylicum]AQS08508.1 nitric oxide reductase [Clostridium saccharobutylicum]AQS12773.1 nitric oxide reductase [Clostridium saccharobutylicum]